MSRYQKQFRVMGLTCLVDSELPFQLVDSFDAFSFPSGKPDLIFEVHAAGEINTAGYRLVKTYEGELCYRIYENGQEQLKISYDKKQENALRWCISRSFAEPDRYVYAIAESWFPQLRAFDPFLLPGLPLVLSEHSALLLHASVISTEGRGVVFTAPSGVGKSTQADLWVRYRGAEILNGDRGLIRRQDGNYLVYGSPYAGSSYLYKDRSAPLRAIFVLKQAKENRISRLSPKEKFMHLLSQIQLFRDDGDVVNCQMDAIGDLIRRVPVYCLECTPDQAAVELVYDFLKETE